MKCHDVCPPGLCGLGCLLVGPLAESDVRVGCTGEGGDPAWPRGKGRKGEEQGKEKYIGKDGKGNEREGERDQGKRKTKGMNAAKQGHG